MSSRINFKPLPSTSTLHMLILHHSTKSNSLIGFIIFILTHLIWPISRVRVVSVIGVGIEWDIKCCIKYSADGRPIVCCDYVFVRGPTVILVFELGHLLVLNIYVRRKRFDWMESMDQVLVVWGVVVVQLVRLKGFHVQFVFDWGFLVFYSFLLVFVGYENHFLLNFTNLPF